MNNFSEERRGLAGNLASAFCSAAEFLNQSLIGGFTVGALMFIVALIAAVTLSQNLGTYLFVYLLIIATIAGQVAHILICRRTGLGEYLLEMGLRLAGLGVGWWITYAFLDFDSFVGVIPIIVMPFVGDGVHALYRKRFPQT